MKTHNSKIALFVQNWH